MIDNENFQDEQFSVKEFYTAADSDENEFILYELYQAGREIDEFLADEKVLAAFGEELIAKYAADFAEQRKRQ